MEDVRFFNTHQQLLVGYLYQADGERIVILAHGFLNDKSSQGRFERMAGSLAKAGISALAFDFSGSGGSDPAILSAAGQVDDLRAALQWARGRGYRQIGLFGNSLGSYICLRCADEGIRTMVLMGALTHNMHYDWDAIFPSEKMEELKREGVMTLQMENGSLRKLGHQMLRDFEEIDQQALLASVACPVLILHGDHAEDQEELTLLGHSRAGMKWLPASSHLEVIEGAGHGCVGYMDRVVDLAVAWFSDHFTGPDR